MKQLFAIIVMVLTLLSVSSVRHAIAQDNLVDSLESVLKRYEVEKRQDTSVVRLLGRIARHYRDRSPSRSMDYAQQSIALAIKLNDSIGLGYGLNNIGVNYESLGRYDLALENLHHALTIRERIGDKRGISNTLSNIGLVSMRQGKYQFALEMYSQSLAIKGLLADRAGTADSYNNIGRVYDKQGDYDRALEYFFKTLVIWQDLKDSSGQAYCFNNIAEVYLKQKESQRALEYCLRAVSIRKKTGENELYSFSLNNLGKIYRALGRYNEALEALQTAIDVAENIGIVLHEQEAHSTMSEVYAAMGNDREALRSYKRSVALRDSVFSKENTQRVAELEARFMSTQKDKEIEELEHEQQLQSTRQNTLVLGIALLVALVVVVTIGYRQKLNANNEILRQQEILEHQSVEIEIINTQVQEQNLELSRSVEKINHLNINLEAQKFKAESLLLNVLPEAIAERLKAGEQTIVDSFPSATVLFADIVGFTQISAQITPEALVELLNRIFTTFDDLVRRHGVEKIKTIGDNYMVVGGVPKVTDDHCERIARLALAMLHAIESGSWRTDDERGNRLRKQLSTLNSPLSIRIGIHTGPIVAGVLGTSKFSYDLWGDTVNTASRMESHGEANTIHVSEEVYRRLSLVNSHATLVSRHEQDFSPITNDLSTKGKFVFVERGELEIKGKGLMKTYFIVSESS